jgi:hypothetical protein
MGAEAEYRVFQNSCEKFWAVKEAAGWQCASLSHPRFAPGPSLTTAFPRLVAQITGVSDPKCPIKIHPMASSIHPKNVDILMEITLYKADA